jgi:hypothetical protein
MNGCLCILFGVVVLLCLYILRMNEHFRLSKELTSKYLKQKKQELLQEYQAEAVEYCSPLLKLSLRWSPDESEVLTIEKKPFPCGNTVSKCMKKVMKLLQEGKPLPDMPQNIIEMANS